MIDRSYLWREVWGERLPYKQRMLAIRDAFHKALNEEQGLRLV